MTIFDTTFSCAHPGYSCSGNKAQNAAGASVAPTSNVDVVDLSPEGLAAVYSTSAPAASVTARTVKLSEQVYQWAFGVSFSSDHGTASRSEMLRFQAKSELSERVLNTRIAEALKKHGVSLDSGERLDFSIDQTGKITIGEGFDDKKRRQIEAALNGDGNIAQELLLYQVRSSCVEKGSASFLASPFDVLDNTILAATYDHNRGGEGSLDALAEFEFQFDFSYTDGRIFRGDDPDAGLMFGSRIDALESVSLLVGLEEPTGDFDTFVEKLDELVQKESDQITTALTGLMKKAELDDVTQMLTFAQDGDGNIVIREDIRADQKKELEDLINADETLVEQIKNLSAKMDVLAELTQATEDEPDYSDDLLPWEFEATLDEFNGRPDGFDLSSEKLAPAREQLLKSYLNENGVALDEIAAERDENGRTKLLLYDKDGNVKPGEEQAALDRLLSDVAGLGAELVKLVEAPRIRAEYGPDALPAPKDAEFATAVDSTEPVHSLVSIKRGELSKAEDEVKNFDEAIQYLRKLVGKTNGPVGDRTVFGTDEPLEILDMTFSFDERGNLRVETLKTNSTHELDNRIAENLVNQGLARNEDAKDFAEKLAGQMFAQHDDQHGDVGEFQHNVAVAPGPYGDYRFASPEADAAALEEMNAIGVGLGAALNEYFNANLPVTQSFNIFWEADNGLSLDAEFATSSLGQSVGRVLSSLNERYRSDDPMNDSLFENELTPDLKGILTKLFDLKEAHGKLHDPARKETGMMFAVRPA